MSEFPEPTDPRVSRSEVLREYVDYFRERAIEKVSELDREQLRASAVPSGWSPIELLNHLLWVERRWLDWGFLGEDVEDPWSDEWAGRWHVPLDVDLEAVVDQLRGRSGLLRELLATHELSEVGAPGPRWRGAEPATLERVLLHLVQEWARHLGQLDVVVELMHGRTGE